MARVSNVAGNIIHFHTVRMTVNGIGNLRLSVNSRRFGRTQENPNPIVMSMTTDREPSRLFNFKSQSVRLNLETTGIGEYFRINRIILFVKPTDVDYPR